MPMKREQSNSNLHMEPNFESKRTNNEQPKNFEDKKLIGIKNQRETVRITTK